MTVNWGICYKNMANLQSQICEFADKKTAYNEVHVYKQISNEQAVYTSSLNADGSGS
jgi:hypothetical protein